MNDLSAPSPVYTEGIYSHRCAFRPAPEEGSHGGVSQLPRSRYRARCALCLVRYNAAGVDQRFIDGTGLSQCGGGSDRFFIGKLGGLGMTDEEGGKI